MSADKTALGSGAKDASIREIELQAWARRLGISHKELEDAVGVVGCNAEAVHRYLLDRSGHVGHKPGT